MKPSALTKHAYLQTIHILDIETAYSQTQPLLSYRKFHLDPHTVKYLIIVNQTSKHHNDRAMALDHHLPEILIGVW